MIIMILGVILLVAGIGFVVFRNIMQQIAQGSAPQPPVVVTAMKAAAQEWQPQLNAVGSLRAVRGVDVTTEIAGLVREIRFKSGDEVKAGAVLVQLNADSDLAHARLAQGGGRLGADHADPRPGAIGRRGDLPSAGRRRRSRFEEQARPGRQPAGDHRQEDDPRAVFGTARHHARQSGPVPEPGRQGGHAADHRSDLHRLQSASTTNQRGIGGSAGDGAERRLSGTDVQRQGDGDRCEGRYHHPQCADRGHGRESEETVAARHVRARRRRFGREEVLSDSSPDGDHLQSLRRNRVRHGREEGCERQCPAAGAAGVHHSGADARRSGRDPQGPVRGRRWWSPAGSSN